MLDGGKKSSKLLLVRKEISEEKRTFVPERKRHENSYLRIQPL